MTCKNCQCGKGGCGLPETTTTTAAGSGQVGEWKFTARDTPADTWAKTQMWGTLIGAGLVALFLAVCCCGGMARGCKDGRPNFEADGMSVDGFTTPTLESRP